ncbi:MAG: hypothetical protein K2P84_14325, partial [Undibacterium sp.]|nr:hypothetical protein [Undibacterium sp.]
MALKDYFPTLSPRQLFRYITSLEQQGLSILSYRTKTTGPYVLNIDPNDLELPPSTVRASNHTSKIRSASPPQSEALATCLAPEWATWIEVLMNAVLCLNNAHYPAKDNGAHYFLALAEETS